MSITTGLEEAIHSYNRAAHHLNQVLQMPDDVFPNIGGKLLTEAEKKLFILGIEYAIAALEGKIEDEDTGS